MDSSILIGLAAIFVLGIGAQWLSWQLRIPSILPLLLCGFIAGPVTGLIDPESLFGDLLFPVVSLSVGVILFEGGLSLKLSELAEMGKVLRNLILIGAAVTWGLVALMAFLLLDVPVSIALLIGAVLVVTGPTVVLPLLRQVHPRGQLGPILKWEAILIDPLGATLALLVFQGIVIGETTAATLEVGLAIVRTIIVGGGAGMLGAMGLTVLLRRYWIPDFLQNPVTMMFVVGIFAVSNTLQHESGLLAVTVMGIYLANQKSTDIRHIAEFKENLRVLLISGLFIVLAASLRIEDLRQLPWTTLAFLGAVILIVRPAAVALATWRSDLELRERALLAWFAPRGIVAAAVASIFSLRLEEQGIEEAAILAPLTFVVIAGTVTLYGLSARPVARLLAVAQPNPKGVLIVGAHRWARALASELKKEEITVLMADTNWALISSARFEGFRTYFGNVLSEHASEEMNLDGIGRMLALTPNDEVNSLAAMHFTPDFGRAKVYQLAPEEAQAVDRRRPAPHLRGRDLFGEGMTYDRLKELFSGPATTKKTRITEEFTYEHYQELYGDSAILLVVIDESGDPKPVTAIDPPKLRSGDLLVSLVTQRGDEVVAENAGSGD